MRFVRSLATFATACALAAVTPVGAAAAEPVRFQRDVRPILVDHCFRCHGLDEEARQADLRLDTREGLFGETTLGHVVVPGKPKESELVQRITSDDASLRMPPAEAKKPLTAKQIDVLNRWVAEGAEWEGHWAFTPPERPTPLWSRRFSPTADVDARTGDGQVGNLPYEVRTPIDRFVLARLEREGLEPGPEADEETLIRRVTLDLTGLPPTPAEVDAFLADDSPDAYDRLVDRLLASPRYGERMAVDWLDAARYADTSGYQNDGPREMWRWRDWVIDAYNANQPFDEFSIEQLAGDLLPNATLEQRIATGFNRNHRGNSEGGIIPEEFAVEYVVDRVDTTATVWLGLTMGCARCHDHKYDPVSQREFYRLYDYFNDVPESGRAIKEGNSPPYVKAPTEEQRDRLAELDAAVAKAERTWNSLEEEVTTARRTWERSLPEDVSLPWTIAEGLLLRQPSSDDVTTVGSTRVVDGPPHVDEAFAFDGETFHEAGDVGRFGYFDRFTVSAWVKPTPNATGGLVTRMSDDSYSDGWAMHLEDGRVQGLFVRRWLDDALRVETERRLEPGTWQHVALVYDGSRTAEGVRVFVDGEEWTLRVLLDGLNQSFTNDEPLRVGSTGTKRRISGAIADARVYDRALDAAEVRVVSVPAPIEALVRIPEGERSAREATKLERYFVTEAAPVRLQTAWERRQNSQSQRETFHESLPTVMVMQQMDPPRPAFVLTRGEYNQPGDRVEAGVPVILSAQTQRDAGADRLALARWLFDPQHPLTARVAVNREWQRFFGTGIVETTEDFGTQGSPPSHPELLDWLATEFVRTGWDVKRLHRLIVTSATYRQSSRLVPELAERDPENRLLARGPRFRLPAETVRDQALAIAGLLTERIGGPSVKPYQPDGLWAEIATTTKYERSTGPDLYRRSVYSYKKRTVANPTMVVFDATTRESCQVRRSRTNTPLQALTLMNDVTFVEAARALAERALQRGSDSVEWMFRRATSRRPSGRERELLNDALASHRSHYAEHPDAARALIGRGESQPDASLDPVELAAHTAVASLILNLDEVVTKE